MSGADNSTESDWLVTGAASIILWIGIITIILFVVISLVLLIYRCFSQMKKTCCDYRLRGHMKNVKNPSTALRYRPKYKYSSDPEMVREEFESVTLRRESKQNEDALRREIKILKIKLGNEKEKSDQERRESERKFGDMEHEIERLKVLSHERKVEEEEEGGRWKTAHGYSMREEDDTLKSLTDIETEASVSLLAVDGQKQPFSSMSGDVSRVYFAATNDEQSQTEHGAHGPRTKTVETQADSWELWSYQLGIEDPEKICQRLSKVEEELPRIEFDLDKSLADLQQSESDNSRAEIYLKISELYLSIGKFEKALNAATLAIELLRDACPEDKESKKLLLISLCCATESCTGICDVAKAIDHHEQAENVIVDISDATPEYESLRSRVERIQQHITMFRSGKVEEVSIAKKIGLDGGVLELDDSTIYFPRGALQEDKLLHATTREDDSESPNGKVRITPILKLNPNTQLNAAATVKLATWLASDDPTFVQIYYKATENSEWEEHDSPIRFQGSDRVEFIITEFCEFCGVINKDDAARRGFRINSCLFYDPKRNQLTNCMVFKCGTRMKYKRKEMRKREYKQACSNDPAFQVKVGDSIEVGIKNSDEERPFPRVLSKKVGISMEFLEDNEHDSQDFSLPVDWTGIVGIVHTVTQYRNDLMIGDPKVHDSDRIRLESPTPQQNLAPYNVIAHTAAVGGSSVNMSTHPMHGSSLDVRQTFFGESSTPHDPSVHTNIAQNLAINSGHIESKISDTNVEIAYSSTVVAGDEDRNQDGINESTV